MIKKLLFPTSLVIAVVLGGVGADFLRNKSASGSGEHMSEMSKTKTSDKKKSAKKKGKGSGKKDKKNKKGKDGKDEEGSDNTNDVTYMKFKRQFVVPIMGKGKIQSLILLNINLELGKNAPQKAYTLEPKLRDAIMRELLVLSHEGAFSDELTSMATYDKLRGALLDAAQGVMKNGVTNVLILDLMRQDQ